MPVIGRLDGQVDEVIIAPISNRRGEEESLTNTDDETSTHRAPSAPVPSAPTQTPPTCESSAKADELPVWLL
jgi:hypothetical protein